MTEVFPTNPTEGCTVKHLMFRLQGAGPSNFEQGLISGPDADRIVSAYKAKGWKVVHAQVFGTDPQSASIVYVLEASETLAAAILKEFAESEAAKEKKNSRVLQPTS